MIKGEVFMVSEITPSEVIGEYIRKHYPGYSNVWGMTGKQTGYRYVVHHERESVEYYDSLEIQFLLNRGYKISDDFLFQENLKRILE